MADRKSEVSTGSSHEAKCSQPRSYHQPKILSSSETTMASGTMEGRELLVKRPKMKKVLEIIETMEMSLNPASFCYFYFSD